MSVISGSSFASGGPVNSEFSERQLPTKDDGTVDDDEMDLDEEHQSLISGVFGVIYTVSREREVSWKFVAFKIFLDAWQLLMLTINPAYGWTIDATQKWWYAVSFIQLNQFVADRGLTFFLVWLYIFVVLLAAVVAVCIWVAWSFKNKRFDHVWPITFLRWFGVIFFQMLDIASMNLILMAMDAPYFGTDKDRLYYHNEFPTIYILSMPYVIHVFVAAISMIVFTALSSLFSMGEMELNMVTKNPLAMAHPRVEVLSFLLKFVMTTGSVFLATDDGKWLAVLYIICSWALLYLTVKWNPCYHAWMNYVRAGTYGAVFFSSAMLLLLVFIPGVDPNDSNAVQSWRHQVTIGMVAGLVPAALLFALAAYLRLRYFQVVVVNRFRNAPPGTKNTNIHEFSHPLEVEITARCCRKWVDKDTLDEEAVQLASRILEVGMQQLPKDAYMVILYSSFHIDVQDSFQTGLLELRAAKKADPSFLERFAIFSREQQLTQKAASGGAKGGKGADLVSYVEQQHDYRLAMKVHKEALQATSFFWKTLMHSEVKLGNLTEAVSRFDVCVKHADTVYRNMLQRHPENWRLLRMYAKFVEFIKNDPWGASKWNAEAERLWQEEDDDKHNIFTTSALGDKNEKTAQLIKSTMDDNSKGVIIMNAQCIIGMINKTACNIFGYDIRGLRGKNIKMLLPSPFAEQHDGWVRNYTMSERSQRPLERTAKWVALHHDRYVFGVSLWIAKISGSGMDSMFLGTIEALPVPPNSAYAWVLGNGALISTDNTFNDWFGYVPVDLAGCMISSLITEEHRLDDAFKPGLARDAAKYAAGRQEGAGCPVGEGGSEEEAAGSDEVHVEDIHIKHKYAGPIKCSMTITYGGVGQHHLFIINIRRAPEAGLPMMVADQKGRLCHVSKDIASALGYPVPLLLGDMAATVWDTILPEPFSQLHKLHLTRDLPDLAPPFSRRSGLTVCISVGHKRDLPDLAPPFSCRSGLSVCLRVATSNGPRLQPFKLRVETRKQEEGEACSIVTFKKSSMEQALDERRLSIIIDETGTVTNVGNSPSWLFGFDPKHIVGRPISELVDIFHPDSDQANVDLSSYSKDMLVLLAKSNPPLELGESKRRSSMLADLLVNHMQSKGVRPAAMQVKLKVSHPNPEMGLSLSKGRMVSMMRDRPPSASSSMQGTESVEKEGQKAVQLEQSEGAVQMEVLLWRADLLTGVVQLDPSGQVVATSNIPFHDPGVLLGLSSEKLLGCQLRELLPIMKSRLVEDIFLPGLGISSAAEGRRGGLKRDTGSGRRKPPGAVNIVRAAHLVDGQEMELQVQAAHSWAGRKGIFIILHAHKPSHGMPGFKDWLQAHPSAGKQPSTNTTTSHATLRGSAMLSAEDSSDLPASGPHHKAQAGPAASRHLRFINTSGRVHGVSAEAAVKLPGATEEALLDTANVGGEDAGNALDRTLDTLMQDLVKGSGEHDMGPRVKAGLEEHCQEDLSPGATTNLGDAKVDRIKAWVMTGRNSVSGGLTTQATHASAGGSSDEGSRGEGGNKEEEEEDAVTPFVSEQPGNMHLLVKDAIGALGGNRGSPSEDGDGGSRTGDDERARAGADSMGSGGDYRRGQRFKRVARLLMGEETRRSIRTFKLQAWGAAGFVVLISVTCFVTMLVLLTQQQQGVKTLNTVGHVGNEAGDIYVSLVDLHILFSSHGVPGLPGLSTSDDIPAQLAKLSSHALNLQTLLSDSYFQIMSEPDKLGLHELWNDATLNVTMYYDLVPGAPPSAVIEKKSLWDTGNVYLKASFDIVHNAYAYNASLPPGAVWRDWTNARMISANVVTILAGVFTTLDGIVQIVIDNTNNMNKVQYILMGLEGCLCSMLVLLFVMYITTKMTVRRWTLYNVFMAVPVGLLKALAAKTLTLDEIELEPVEPQGGLLQEEQGAHAGDKAPAKITLASSLAGSMQGRTLWRSLLGALSWLAFWRKRDAVSPVYTKRRLLNSRRNAVWLASPFLVWGIMMIAINASGHAQLAKVSGPIGLFNLVNFVIMRYYRNFSLLQDLIQITDPTEKATQRALALKLFLLPAEYQAMCFGGLSVPQTSSEVQPAHFLLAPVGVAFSGSQGADILYHTRQCLRLDQSTCLPPSHPLYTYTVNGLDMLMQQYMYYARTVLGMNGTDPHLDGPEFNYMWNTHPDILGGLNQLNQAFYNYVISVYSGTLQIHIIGLVFSVLLMAFFVFAMLRPFLTQVGNETRRIAELLNQLPTDVDVESLVRRAQQLNGSKQLESSASQNNASFKEA